MKRVAIVWLLYVGVLAAAGCANLSSRVSIATGPQGSPYNAVGSIIAQHWVEDQNKTVAIDSGNFTGPIANCRLLVNRQVDFALIQDDAPIDSCLDRKNPRAESPLRTVCPLYPEILFILHKPGIKASTLHELVSGRRVGLGPQNCAGAQFARKLFASMGVPPESFRAVYTDYTQHALSDSVDVVIYLTTFNDRRVEMPLRSQSARLFSLDDPGMLGKGSAVEGFSERYQHAHPHLIAKNSYGRLPETAVLTLAVDILLVTHKDVDDVLVYNLTHSLLDEEPLLANRNPLFHYLDERFDHHTLDFPLHEGSLRYLNREKPNFLEQNAEVLALGITVGGIVFGLLTTLLAYLRQRKRERIDVYYRRSLEIEALGHTSTDPDVLVDLIGQLDVLQEEAIHKLMEKKLVSDDHFSIFIALANSHRQALMHRLQLAKKS
jgi:TRAP transporter TAXI family solute receptor